MRYIRYTYGVKLGVLLCVFLTITSVFSRGRLPEEETQLKLALQAYTKKDYSRAILFAEPLIEQLKLSNQNNILLAHEIIAMSYCENKQSELGLKHLKAIFDFDQQFKGSLETSKICRDWTLSTQNKKIQALKYHEKTSLLWSLAPFGALQFRQERKAKAWTFLLTQSLGLALGTTSYILYRSSQNKDGTVPNGSHAETFRWLNWGGFGTATLSYGLNAIDSYHSLP